MAEVPYGQGIGQVSPDATAQNDYQNIHATPESFGAGIARGMEQLGSGLEKTANFYAQAAVDDQLNKDQERINQLLRGNGSQVGFNSDGSPQYDLGYMGLHGRDALDARGGVETQIADIIKQSKGNLSTPAQVHAYETAMRRYESFTRDKIGQHADSQANQWYQSVNKSSADLALNNITQNAYSEEEFRHAQADLQKTYMDQVTLEGGTGEQYRDAIMRARRDALHARVEAISVNDPIRAERMVEENKDDLGSYYQPLSNQMKGKADHLIGVQDADARWAESASQVPLTSAGNPIYTRVADMGGGRGFSSGGLFTLSQVESAGGRITHREGSKYQGIAQMGPDEFKRFGPPGGDVNNPEDNLIAANNYAKYNSSILRASLNIIPTDGQLYIAHQQGAGGALKLLGNPDERAIDMVGESHILNNVPPGLREQARNWTSNQFTDYWERKFDAQKQASIMPGSSQAINQSLDDRRRYAITGVMDSYKNGQISLDQQESALRRIHENYSSNKILEDSNKEMKKEIENKAASDIYLKIKDPSNRTPDLLQEILTNKDLGDNWQLRDHLYKMATDPKKDQTVSSENYLPTMRKVLNHEIDTYEELLRMQTEGKLTDRDVSNLATDLMRISKDPAELQLQKTKEKSLKGIEDQVVRFGIPGMKFESAEGNEFFRTNVVNRFETEFKQFRQTEEGKKDPYKFFEQKNLKRFLEGAPGIENVTATNLTGKNAAPAQTRPLPTKQLTNIPPMPDQIKELGITESGWKNAMNTGPTIKGQVRHLDRWDEVVSDLLANKDNPEAIEDFNAQFKAYNLTAQDVFDAFNNEVYLTEEEQRMRKHTKPLLGWSPF